MRITHCYENILEFIIYHFDPNNLYEISNFPNNYADYLERLEYVIMAYRTGNMKLLDDLTFTLQRDSKMVWLDLGETEKQKYLELRLHATKTEMILLDFNPLRPSQESDWNPKWEEWHCYQTPLRIYRQDYELLIPYFSKIYPTTDAFDGTPEPVFDVCFDNWIGARDWKRILQEIEKGMENHSTEEKEFLISFIEWVKEALQYTEIIVVEGNL